VLIQVYQGEREMAAFNKRLGTFELTGLPPAPQGVPQIEVTFDIDADGIVHVSAKDTATGKEQSMTITGGSALSEDEIDRMTKDAEEHAEEDLKRRDEAETRNSAETLVHQTEKFLGENAEKIPEDGKSNVEGPLEELKKALQGTDVDEIKSTMEKVGTATSALGASMYAQAQAEQQDAGGGEGGDGDEDIVEAEIVDEDEDK
jgi:molecular chaperone DnaK